MSPAAWSLSPGKLGSGKNLSPMPVICCCGRRNSELASYCPLCGSPLSTDAPESRALRLSGLPVAEASLGNLIFCVQASGLVDVVSMASFKLIDSFQLPLDLVTGERIVVDNGLLLACGNSELVVDDLWHRYLGKRSFKKRSLSLKVDGQVASELLPQDSDYYLLSRSDGYSLLAKYSFSDSWLRRERVLELDCLSRRLFAGLATTNSHILVGAAGSATITLICPEALRVQDVIELGFELRHDGIRSYPFGTLVVGAQGELALLNPITGRVQAYLMGAFESPLLAWAADPQRVILCHGSSLRCLELDSQREFRLRLPQRCGVTPVFSEKRAYLMSDEGSLYVVEVSAGDARVTKYQPIFLGRGGTPISPRLWGESLICFGGDHELVRFRVDAGASPELLWEAVT